MNKKNTKIIQKGLAWKYTVKDTPQLWHHKRPSTLNSKAESFVFKTEQKLQVALAMTPTTNPIGPANSQPHRVWRHWGKRGIKLFWPLPWRGRTCRFVSDGRRPAAWQEKNHRGQWIEGTTGWRPAFGGRRLLTWRPPWTGSPAAWPCLLAILPAARRTCWPGRPAPGLGPDTASPAPAPCWHCSPLRPPYTHNRNKVVTREYIIKLAISSVFFLLQESEAEHRTSPKPQKKTKTRTLRRAREEG